MPTILDEWEKTVESLPEHVIVRDGNGSITRRSLQQMARKIGSVLAKEKNMHGCPVVLYLDKSTDLVAAMLGAVYSARPYVVMDTRMPAARMALMVKTLRPFTVLTDAAHREEAEKRLAGEELFLLADALREQEDHARLARVRETLLETDPLYILFTSGSTGEPKGTVVCHRSVLAYAAWVTETFSINETTVFGSQTPLYFSMSVLDLYSTLCTGATLVLIPQQLFTYPIQLFKYMTEQGINTIYWVPTAMGLVSIWDTFSYVKSPPLRCILFAGEVMPLSILDYWMSHIPDAIYANLFGPTETTDIFAWYRVCDVESCGKSVPIGRAIRGCRIYLIGEDGRAVSDGEIGEMAVGGAMLAEGYYRNPEKTTEAFVQNPLQRDYPERVYRTGDLARRDERGELIYIGRKDDQIKHKGYRIELGEIEAAAYHVRGIGRCACIYDEQENRLVLFYQSKTPQDKIVLEELRKRVPGYMMPGRLVAVSSIPTNANGKIDRIYLRDNYKQMVNMQQSQPAGL